jgi:hypothetical protein
VPQADAPQLLEVAKKHEIWRQVKGRRFCAVSAGRVGRLQNGTDRRQLSSGETF